MKILVAASITLIVVGVVGCASRSNPTLSDNKAIVLAGMAPNCKTVTIHEAAIYKVVDGKIVEQWGFPDSQSLMQQLMAPAAGK